MKARYLIVASALALAACASPDVETPVPPPRHSDNLSPVTVFFDYEKANLTGAAADQIADVVARNGHMPAHEVLTGFCDTAERHCEHLGLRRAEAVKDELVRRGMPASAIEVHASGDLLVPTGRHVREPQNRRVVIDPR